MPTALRESDKSLTFFIDLGDGSGAEGVYVVPMSDTEKDNMRRKFTTRKVTRNGVEESLDTQGFFHARLKRTIKDWVGFHDRAGNDIACTPETIVECAEMNSLLFLEIMNSADRLAETGREVSEKNLKRGQGAVSAAQP